MHNVRPINRMPTKIRRLEDGMTLSDVFNVFPDWRRLLISTSAGCDEDPHRRETWDFVPPPHCGFVALRTSFVDGRLTHWAPQTKTYCG